MKIKGAYDCSYCHGDIDNACTACDPECDCVELHNHSLGECEPDCRFCEEEQKKVMSRMGKRSAASRFKGMSEEEKSAKMRDLRQKGIKKKTD